MGFGNILFGIVNPVAVLLWAFLIVSEGSAGIVSPGTIGTLILLSPVFFAAGAVMYLTFTAPKSLTGSFWSN